MTEPLSKNQNRRKLLTDTLRFAGLGLLGLVFISAVVKRKRLKYEGYCINSNICSGCRIYEDCGLPQALSRKQATEKKNNGTK